MPPKPKTKCRRPGGSLSDDLFHYNNQVELTFRNQPKSSVLEKLKGIENSSSSEEEEPEAILLQKKAVKIESKNRDSSSASSSDSEGIINISSSEGGGNLKSKTDEKATVVAERPVTPPPAVPVGSSVLSRQSLRLSRDVESKLRSLQAVATQDLSPASVPGRSDVVIVDQTTPEPGERKITVRVRTRNGVERFSVMMGDKFESIINQLAESQAVPVDTISLSFTDRKGTFQTVKETDSPISVNLSYADIIECVIVNSAPSHEFVENDGSVVNIKIQGSDSKSVKSFKALKNEPLEDILQQYAQFRQLPLSSLKFSFDGDVITSKQSPDELDMDEDNVVDVQVKR